MTAAAAAAIEINWIYFSCFRALIISETRIKTLLVSSPNQPSYLGRSKIMAAAMDGWMTTR